MSWNLGSTSSQLPLRISNLFGWMVSICILIAAYKGLLSFVSLDFRNELNPYCPRTHALQSSPVSG